MYERASNPLRYAEALLLFRCLGSTGLEPVSTAFTCLGIWMIL